MQTSEIEAPAEENGKPMDASRSAARKFVDEASDALTLVATKLTNPTPEVIREVQGLVASANFHLESASLAPGTLTPDDVKSFRNVCGRVSRLLEGASVGQWNQLRQMGDYLETYQANGCIRDCSVRSFSIDTTG